MSREVIAPVNSQWLTQRQAARALGISHPTLGRLVKRGGVFVPAISPKTCPGLGVKLVRYHSRQVDLIAGVLVGNITAETASAEWSRIKGRFGRIPVKRRTRKAG